MKIFGFVPKSTIEKLAVKAIFTSLDYWSAPCASTYAVYNQDKHTVAKYSIAYKTWRLISFNWWLKYSNKSNEPLQFKRSATKNLIALCKITQDVDTKYSVPAHNVALNKTTHWKLIETITRQSCSCHLANAKKRK